MNLGDEVPDRQLKLIHQLASESTGLPMRVHEDPALRRVEPTAFGEGLGKGPQRYVIECVTHGQQTERPTISGYFQAAARPLWCRDCVPLVDGHDRTPPPERLRGRPRKYARYAPPIELRFPDGEGLLRAAFAAHARERGMSIAELALTAIREYAWRNGLDGASDPGGGPE